MTTQYETQNAGLTTLLATIPSIGNIVAYEELVEQRDDSRDVYFWTDPADSISKVRCVLVSRESVQPVANASKYRGLRSISRVHTWVLDVVWAADDLLATEHAFQKMVDTIIDLLDSKLKISAACDDGGVGPCAVRAIERGILANVEVHRAEIAVPLQVTADVPRT